MPPELAAIAFLTFITLGYIALCAISPLGRCRTCEGLGFALRTTRRGALRRGKDCRRCRATGRRLRLGRRAYNAWLRLYRAGSR
ncbi:hypothetical protein [Streptomyces sp. YIM 98790]|uniref:hypothetical protein n=1 Tax=Streptomyces sp. YIM 98790 TaxID=2689077 RepID=UPI001408B0A0|nr:hypothetical protein [Streptomyces sp. YIM 98790]